MKNNKMELKEILAHIEQGHHFEAVASNGAFKIKVNKYVPYCCTAIHDGSELRQELQKKIALNDYERWYEEDPFTGDFIASMPITIVGLDSRFEYDLNRSPENCIYTEAWGKKVWKKQLTPKEIKLSKEKHASYYKVVHALVAKLETMFGGCIVYDIHSYNSKRWNREVPLFIIGTENVDTKRYANTIEHWQKELAAIKLPQITNRTDINNVFYGRGYNLEYITTHFKNTLVLATEIEKVYCDELTGAAYPGIIRQLQQKLKKAILNNANFYSQKLDGWKYLSTSKLLDKKLDKALLKVDSKLYKLLKDFELLAIVNPTNTVAAKKAFFKKNYSELPQFKYDPIKLNVFELKQKLTDLPVQKIQDISIRNLYESVINSYFDKIDMISTLGRSKFLYNSLRYFGRPSAKDLHNANYILHLPDIPGEAKKEPLLHSKDAILAFKEGLNGYGIKAKVSESNKVISQVMVLNSKQSVLVKPGATFKQKELQALIEHEIGVHMVTTMNSNQQNLKVFNLGLPINTLTQEGLAILAEYLSGNLTLGRLRKLALRVIAVDMMCNGADFVECFNHLKNRYDVEPNLAFNITTRIYRGGGFTKDYLYLTGFVKVLKFWENQNDLKPLLVGKTSIEFYNVIDEMIGREMVAAPKYVTKSFEEAQTEKVNPIYDYILSGLK